MTFYDEYILIGNYPVYYYGIISAIGYLLGVLITCANAKKRDMTSDDIIYCACYIIPLAIIGARLCFVIFNPDTIETFWDIFNLREGGLVFYGGLVGGAIGAILYCVIHKKNFFKLTDIAVCGLVVGQAIGRWGNFVNKEAYGFEVTNPAFQFFPICIEKANHFYLATFFYEFINNLIVFAILQFLLYKTKIKEPGIVTHAYIVGYGFFRFIVEGLRINCVMLGPFKFSQVVSALMFIYGVIYLTIKYVSYKKKSKDKSFYLIMDVLKTKL